MERLLGRTILVRREASALQPTGKLEFPGGGQDPDLPHSYFTRAETPLCTSNMNRKGSRMADHMDNKDPSGTQLARLSCEAQQEKVGRKLEDSQHYLPRELI